APTALLNQLSGADGAEPPLPRALPISASATGLRAALADSGSARGGSPAVGDILREAEEAAHLDALAGDAHPAGELAEHLVAARADDAEVGAGCVVVLGREGHVDVGA